MSDNTKATCSEPTDRQLLLEILRHLDPPQIDRLLTTFEKKPALETTLRKALSVCWGGPEPFTPQDALRAGIQPNSKRSRAFFEELIRFVDRAEMTDPEVYKAAGLNRTLWYRLRDNPNAHTSKRNILKIGLVLRLDYLELYYLLALGGHPFAPICDGTDMVIALCLRDGVYDPFEVDSRLIEAGELALFSEE